MSLATRCMQCGTVFRVVQDQLKVSEGWVRCGRCNEVFNALDGLFDLEREAPPEGTAPEPGRRAELPARLPAPAPDEIEPARDPDLVDRIHAELLTPQPLRNLGAAEPVADAAARAAAEIAGDEPAAAAAEPEFVRRAVAHERWRRSPRRVALAGTVAVLALLLGVQWAAHFRDTLAARVPLAAPLLARACASLNCTLAPPRRIDAIAVESSALARTTVADVFRLSVTLRNRDSIALALPAIELSLTDASGALVARRVLAPADFRVAAAVIAAGAEQTLQLPLSAGSGRVAGYTVEIFYP